MNKKLITILLIALSVIPLIVLVISIQPKDKEYAGPAYLSSTAEDYEKLGLDENIVQPWEDSMRTDGKEGSYEWWYTDAEFEDGTTVVAIYFTKYRFDVDGPANPTAQVEITHPNGEIVVQSYSLGEGTVIDASKEYCDVKIGDSYLYYDGEKYNLKYDDGEIIYEATMVNSIPMWRPDTGHWRFGDDSEDYMAWVVAQPASTIEAKLTIDGETKELKGRGYHDHNWGNIAMHEIIDHWYWGRGQIGDYYAVWAEIVANKEYGYSKIPMMLVSKDGEIVDLDHNDTILDRKETITHEGTGKFFNPDLVYSNTSKDGLTYSIESYSHQDIVVSHELDELPFTQRMIGKLMGADPTYLRTLGDLKLIVSDGETILETYESEGIWEQMHLSKSKDPHLGSVHNE